MQGSKATNKARILFVDDEKRVLNSMRGMFRREFELYLTTEGEMALKIAAETPIDVIVADQRMPGMTGTEVLGKIKQLSPDTIRILLTGYADPGAIENSINVGEVFRFLSKPCPPKELRETLKLAVRATRASQSAQVLPPAEPLPAVPGQRPITTGHRVTSARLSQNKPAEPVALAARLADPTANAPPPEAADHAQSPVRATQADNPLLSRLTSIGEVAFKWNRYRHSASDDESAADYVSSRQLGVVIYTVDPAFAETALRALPTERTTTLATSLIKVMRALELNKPGVLITDISSNGTTLQKILSALKQLRPDLVSVVVSDRVDSSDMVRLINQGQVFRFLRKPVNPDALLAAVNAAARKSVELRSNPRAVQRHTVQPASPDLSASDALKRALQSRSPIDRRS